MDWGLAVSASTHAALLLATLIAFSDTKTFEEAQEAVPVEIVTEAQLNEVLRGEKTAKPAPKPVERVERQAEEVVRKPVPVPQPAERETPPPPPPIREALDEPDDAPTPPPRPAPEPKPLALAPTPPPRPEPAPAPAPPTPPHRPEPKPEPKEAQPVPAPAPRVEPPKAEARPEPKPAPTPPVRPKIETAKPEPARDAPKMDQLARLIETKKREEDAQRDAARRAPQAQPSRDPSAIDRLLSRERHQQQASAGPQVSRTASLGAANASAQRMSPSMWGQLDGFLQDKYRGCWNKLGFDGVAYIPQIRVVYNADGALAADPVLVNPSSDPAERSLADSALRAVKRCDPLKIPPEFAPFHAQWGKRTLRFDPEEM